MDAFAFLIHPIDPKRDVTRKYPRLGRLLPEGAIHFLSRFWPPVKISHITGARSVKTEQEIEGWLIAVPYTARRMLALPSAEVYRKIIAAGRLAEDLGAKMLGLGAYTSVVGDGGRTIARELDIAVTTGDSYTAALSVSAIRHAAYQMDIDPARACLAIVGASGAIGNAVGQLLAPHVATMLLIGRDRERLIRAEKVIASAGCPDVRSSVYVADIRQAEIVVAVTSSGGQLLKPEMLRSGAVVCDVSRPRDVSWQTSRARDDVLVIDGGLVRVPGNADFGFDYGVPSRMTYGCVAETMALTFEGIFADYSLGKDLSLAQIQHIERVAAGHGFELAALRSFDRKLDDVMIERVKASARKGG
jgi:fatty aldehyde-generating acyl-ACP reductase